MSRTFALMVPVAIVSVASTAVPAIAQSGPSEIEQRLACMGDALRLCPQFVPNRDKIRRCMAARHDALSAGCRPVFDASMKAYMRDHRDQ